MVGMAPGWRRRLFRVILVLSVCVVSLVLALPLLFPWLLRPLARAWGFQYSTYERAGYSRFRVSDVVGPAGTGEFRARGVEVFVPTIWLLQLKTKERSH